MPLTADDADGVVFTGAPIGRRGYAKHEVDEFVARIARTLRSADDLTAAEVHHVDFSRPLIGKRGYDEREVDDFLDRAEEELLRRTGRNDGYGVPQARTENEAAAPRESQPAASERTSQRSSR